MNIFVTSDTFFGRKLAATQGGFSSLEEMEDRIIENWNAKIKPNDIVYHLGNFGWDPISTESAIIHLNGKIFFVGGEYDKHLSEISLVKIGKHVLLPAISEIPKINTVFSHWPLSNWANREEGSIHIHGGLKQEQITNRFCANIANWNWSPIEFDFINDIVKQQQVAL
jgi:calcineurin-like phosphoesterase family protein